ncbi:MAG: GWxTD domain-containing protein [bacterium]
MKKIIFVFLFCSGFVFSQSNLYFDFDFARFRYDSTSSYIEIYYNISQSTLTHVVKNDSVFVSTMLNIKIYDSTSNKYAVDNMYQVVNSFPLTDSIQNQNLIGKTSYLLNKGKYNLSISVTDTYNSDNKKSISDNFIILPFVSNNFIISDIELANNIKQEGADKDSYFYKNSFEIIPNPVSVYGENNPLLFYYTELYNLDNEMYNNNLVLERLIINGNGKIVNKKIRTITGKSESIVEVGHLNLMKFPSGNYVLVLNLIDTSKNIGITSNKKFFLVNKNVIDSGKYVQTNMDFLTSEFGAIEIDEVDAMYEICKYIASNQEKEQFKLLDSLDAKRKFLYDFWQRRDYEPETAENEFKIEYFKRVNYASTHFTEFQKNGALTDRGRVYLTYGEPDEIENKPNEVDSKPYQLWYYNSIEGGVEFVFADLSGYSQFELIHSTKRGELKDSNYMNRIKAAKDY